MFYNITKHVGGIGDVLIFTALPRILSEQGHEVFVECHYPEVFQTNPYVRRDSFLVLDDDEEDITICLDNAYELRPHMHYWQAIADVVGVPPEPLQRAELYLSEEETAKARKQLEHLPHPWVILAPFTGADWPGKSLPVWTWIKIVAGLKKQGYTTILLKPGVKTIKGVDVEINAKSLRELASVVAVADSFIGHDSAPLHLAQAAKLRGVVIIGMTDSRQFSLVGDEIKPVFNKKIDCIGCHHRKKPPVYAYMGCDRKDLACMFNLEADEVLEEFVKW